MAELSAAFVGTLSDASHAIMGLVTDNFNALIAVTLVFLALQSIYRLIRISLSD